MSIDREQIEAILRSLRQRTEVDELFQQEIFELADGRVFVPVTIVLKAPPGPPDLGIRVSDGVGVGEVVMGKEVEKDGIVDDGSRG